ncbi:MAG: respiratory nitrate reductase subunit gamma [Planctomycetota bacterium]
MSGSFLIVLSYFLLAVFAVAFVVRAVRIARLPMHLRWELAPVPHEKGKGHYGGSFLEEYEWWTKPREKSLVSEAIYMFQEIAFLKAVWEHNRRLWWFTFPFHTGLYLLIAAVVPLAFGWNTGASVLAGAGFVLGGLGALGLLISRFADSRLKVMASPASRFNLLVLLAVFATGAWALAASDGFADRMREFGWALLTANASVKTPGIVAAHLVVALLFLAYLPFTQMMHFVAKYFTYHQVRWNDEPMERGSRMEKEVTGLLGQPMTWAGPHVKADGKKNWVDIATEDTTK